MASDKYTPSEIAKILTDTEHDTQTRIKTLANILIEGKFTIDTRDKDDMTLLHRLASYSTPVDPQIIPCLTRVSKANVNAVIDAPDHVTPPGSSYPFNIDGATPLHLAVGHNQMALAAAFIIEGADVNAQDAKGNTSLDIFLKKNCKTNTLTLSSNIELGILLISSGTLASTETKTLERNANTIATESGHFFGDKGIETPEVFKKESLKSLASIPTPNTEYAKQYIETLEQESTQQQTRSRSGSIAKALQRTTSSFHIPSSSSGSHAANESARRKDGKDGKDCIIM